jgi:excisionase family DNA binding protein
VTINRETILQQRVSPKQVARAIGVSESTLKRWCDQGLIPTVRTMGGHRRLLVSAVIRFLQKSQRVLVAPQLLGLPATCGKSDRILDRAPERLRDGLLTGDEALCRQIVFDLWLAGQRIALIADHVIAVAFAQIGEKCACRDVDVYQERQACEIMLRILHELQTGLAPPQVRQVALGGTPDGDHDSLPATMAETVLQECGWNARSLGPSLPFESLAAAIRDKRPQLFWLSVSFIGDVPAFREGFDRLHEATVATGTALAIGGFALRDPSLLNDVRFSAHCKTMQQLAEFAGTLGPVSR